MVSLLPWFVASNDLLKDSNTCSSFSFPVFRIRIQSLEHIKRFCSIIELAHLKNKHLRVRAKRIDPCDTNTRGLEQVFIDQKEEEILICLPCLALLSSAIGHLHDGVI